MVVYVKLKVRGREERELVALVNGGAHSPVPVLVVDEVTARELGYVTGEVAEASVADARRKVYIVRETVELSLLGEEGEELSRVKAHLVIHPGLEEPLITDVTIDELGIIVLSFSKGLWRHARDPPDRVRVSAKPPYAL
ncbi:MAG: hypothetical protein QXI60_06815 [Thermofilaceae archaeon]